MNTPKNVAARLLPVLAILLPIAAQAHPGHAAPGWGEGLAHPVTGLDHLLAMLAVCLWAAQSGGARRWAMPALFVGVLAGAGALGMGRAPIPGVEQGIAASVLALGLVIAMAVRPPAIVTGLMVGAFAAFHGFAHGSGMAGGASAATYGAGFLAGTVLLHTCGFALGTALGRLESARPWVRVAGGGIVLAGIALSVA